jgi:alkanesulfonate monooxygenase SsuD/methylene tetrahydromethanopterin reductase-like flavin-dependent oxidoreductase (luciferase family)
MGVDFSGRGRTLDQTIDGLRALLGPDPVTYRDSRIAIEDALVSPKPVTQIPILLGGGSSERAFRRIARKGDGWLPVNMAGPALADDWKRLLDLTGMEGRDPQRMRLIPVAHVTLADEPAGPERQPFQGILNEVIDDIAATAEAGADELIIGLDASVASSAELIDKALALMHAATAAGLRNSTATGAPASSGLAAGIRP